MGDVIVMLLFVPLSEMVQPLVAQLPVPTLAFCCKVQPVEGDGQETLTLLPECVMVRSGAPSVCTAAMTPQNPPVSE